MDSKDLDVKMKIRRIINTPGISDRTIIGKIQGDKGVGKLINTLNQKLEEGAEDEGGITTIKLINPVKVNNPNTTIYDCPNFEEWYSEHNYGDQVFLEINNKKIKAIYDTPRYFYAKETGVDTVSPKNLDGGSIREMLTMVTISKTVYFEFTSYNSYLAAEKYLTQEEINANLGKNKIVAVTTSKPLLLTNGYYHNPFLTIIDTPTITPSKLSANVQIDFNDKEILALKYAPTFLFVYPEISATTLVLEPSTVSSNGQKIVFKPIYTVNGILYPVMTYIEKIPNFESYKWSMEINIKAYS